MKKQYSELEEPCNSCKITAVCCLSAISAYLIYQGRLQSTKSRYSMYAIAAVVGALGVGEIFDKSPFRNKS